MTLAIDGYLGLLIAIVGVLAVLALTIDTFATVLGSALEKIVAFVFRNRGVKTGSDGLIGRSCEVVSGFQGSEQGTVRVAGERWQAELVPDAKLPVLGNRLQIESVQGLTLRVRPAGQQQ